MNDAIAAALPEFLQRQRWFGGKGRVIQCVELADEVALNGAEIAPERGVRLVMARVVYAEGSPELYAVPLESSQESGGAVAIRDASTTSEFWRALLARAREPSAASGRAGSRLVGWCSGQHAELLSRPPEPWGAIETIRSEQSNSAAIMDGRVIVKLFRRLEPGINPEIEIGRYLAERRRFSHTAALVGAVEYLPAEGPAAAVATIHEFLPGARVAWEHALDRYAEFAGRCRGRGPRRTEDAPELVGAFLDEAALLGRRTAELHLALVGEPNDEAFAPAPLTAAYQKSLADAVRAQAVRALGGLRGRLPTLAAPLRADAEQLLARWERIGDNSSPDAGGCALARRLSRLEEATIQAARIRGHGDYHLGQVLRHRDDFVIIDFEGEPLRSLEERRQKHSPLRDVAGMIRSLDYAAHAGARRVHGGETWPDAAEPRFWSQATSSAFLKAYRAQASGAAFLPRSEADVRLLLDLHLVEKAFYELEYELNNRPDWVEIPLRGLRELAGD